MSVCDRENLNEILLSIPQCKKVGKIGVGGVLYHRGGQACLANSLATGLAHAK